MRWAPPAAVVLVLAACGGSRSPQEQAWLDRARTWESQFASRTLEPLTYVETPEQVFGSGNPLTLSRIQARAVRSAEACWPSFRSAAGPPPSKSTADLASKAKAACAKFEQAAPFIAKNLHDAHGFYLWQEGLQQALDLSRKLGHRS